MIQFKQIYYVNPDDVVSEESSVKKITNINTRKCNGSHFDGLDSGINRKMLEKYYRCP